VVTGGPVLLFRSGEVREVEVPWHHKSVAGKTVPRPRGYFVLPGWPQIEERLRAHGLRAARLTKPVELEVETMRASQPKLAPSPYQGLVRVTPEIARAMERRSLPAGTLWIPADQPDFEVAVQLLEPEASDSLLSWGLLSSVFEQKEYIDLRVLERLATEKMKDPKVAAEWREALKDPAFAADGGARYQWWYRRTPYWDETVGLLPYFRAMKAPALTTQPWR